MRALKPFFFLLLLFISFHIMAQRFPEYGNPVFPDTAFFVHITKFIITYDEFEKYTIVDTIKSPGILLVRRFDSTHHVPGSLLLLYEKKRTTNDTVSCYSYFIASKKKFDVELYAVNNSGHEFPVSSFIKSDCNYFLPGPYVDDKISIPGYENLIVLNIASYQRVTAGQGYEEDVSKMQLWNLNDFSCTTIITHLKYEWWPYGDGFYATSTGGTVFYDYPVAIEKNLFVITDEQEKKYKYFFNGGDLIKKK